MELGYILIKIKIILGFAVINIHGAPIYSVNGERERSLISSGNNEGHVLKRISSETSLFVGECGDGWIKNGGSCYYFSKENERTTWPKALLECRDKGAYLAEVNSLQENEFMDEQAQFLGSASDFSKVARDCHGSLLTGFDRIPDSALSASSSWDSNHGPSRSRLNQPEQYPARGAWSAASKDLPQWIEADLQRIATMTGVVTQGRDSTETNQWTTKFTVSYSLNCINWNLVKDGSVTKIFTGNADKNTPVTNMFVSPIRARCIRLNPQEWHEHPSLRFDVLGCSFGESSKSLKTLGQIPADLTEMTLWLGGTDILHEGDWKWATSGTEISYNTFHDWHPREPNNLRSNEHCLITGPISGWKDVACSQPSRYVCEKPHR